MEVNPEPFLSEIKPQHFVHAKLSGAHSSRSCDGVHRWGRRPLSERQLVYAALDALASVLIFECIEARIGSDSEMQPKHGLESSDAEQVAEEGKGMQMLPVSIVGQQLTQQQSGVQTPQSRESALPDSACPEDSRGAGHETLDCTPVINGFTVINLSKQSAAQQEAIITEGSASCQEHSGSSGPAEPLHSGHCFSNDAALSGPASSVGMVHTRLQHTQQSTQLSQRAFIQFTEKRRPPYGPPSPRLQPEISGGLKCIHPSFIAFPHIM